MVVRQQAVPGIVPPPKTCLKSVLSLARLSHLLVVSNCYRNVLLLSVRTQDYHPLSLTPCTSSASKLPDAHAAPMEDAADTKTSADYYADSYAHFGERLRRGMRRRRELTPRCCQVSTRRC